MSTRAHSGSSRRVPRGSSLHGCFETARLGADPLRECGNAWMRFQLGNGVISALEFLFRQQLVNLRMAGPADPDHLLNGRACKLALVPLVVVTRSRNQMMTGEGFFATANRAIADGSKPGHGFNTRFAAQGKWLNEREISLRACDRGDP